MKKKNYLPYVLGFVLAVAIIFIIVLFVQVANLKKVGPDEGDIKFAASENTVPAEPVVIMKEFNSVEVDKLATNTLAYLRAMNKICLAESNDYEGIADCYRELLEEIDNPPELKEIGFIDYDSFSKTAGRITYENVGDFSVDSSKFSLVMNRKTVDDNGCLQKGMLGPGAYCILNFYDICISGDILEVYYGEERLMLRTC